MTTALILGAAVWEHGPSPTLRRRTLHAARLWHEGRVTTLIPCGGLGRHPPSEAAAMRDLLIAAGVPATAILLEDRSHSTYENIRNALPLLNGPEIVIVTDAYHAPRARLTARRLGLCPATSSPPLPAGAGRAILREVSAYALYWLRFTTRRFPGRP